MKFYLTLFAISFSFSLLAQPVNDDCGGIINLGEAPYCSDPAQFTNVNATPSNIDPVFNIPDCFNSGGVDRDVWFQFTVPANGSLLDFTVTVYGNDGVNGTLENPQIAVYRGDCAFGELAELDCVSAPNGENTVSLDLIGLTPGLPYFIRINDYSPTATPNSGTFKLCVSEYVGVFNMGEVAGSVGCSGTLFDSGGENNDYSNLENLTFDICPQDFHSCIILKIDYDVEENFDYLTIYQGDAATGIPVIQLSGIGNSFEVQVAGSCAGVEFNSDDLVAQAGFKITWECTASPCTVPPLVTCSDPSVIPALPFNQSNLNNCFSGNSIDVDPCGSGFLTGNDYVFTYTSPGDECINVQTSGTNANAGLGVYSSCPTTPGALCLAADGGNFGVGNPSVGATFLENPGTYYIVFSTNGTCTPFNINVDTVTCPVLLPPASTCDNALNIGGCSNQVPEIIALNPGSGDPNFLVQGVNMGCFVDPQENFSFFYFIAGADGKFGFTVASADPAEASDIDINVWGPIPSLEQICDYTSSNQPVRSTWTGGAVETGLQDIHPGTGLPVTDDYDCDSPATPGAGGDNFVRRIDVQEGEIYVILLDDYGQAIENGGIAIDFTNTTNGVLLPPAESIAAGPDTAVCLGQPVQLFATGGEAYFWNANPDLSCTNCPNPIVIPSENTSYNVQIATTCGIIPKSASVKIYDLNLGPDVTVCAGATFELNPQPFDDVQYNWIGFGLSCNDCPTPTLTNLPAGIFTYFCFMTTPFCTITDTLIVKVLPGQQPQYVIAPDQTICAGEPVQLGGLAQPDMQFEWTSFPPGFTSSESDPVVNPLTTTTYYLTASNPAACPVPVLDSVVINVKPIPIVDLVSDTTVCSGLPVQLANTVQQPDVTYSWAPSFGSMADPNVPNPVESPQANTIYTLQATLGSCTITRTVSVDVVQLFLQINVQDSLRLCQGSSVNIQAQVSPGSTPVTWTPQSWLQLSGNNLNAVATPEESVLYTVSTSLPGCTRQSSVYIAVDSIPEDLSINPSDTTICQGSKVLLTSKVYEPADFQYMDFTWTPGAGQVTPDSLYNMVVQPNETTVYRRITENGACKDTAFAVVKVIIPPQIMVIPADTSICPGEPVLITATVPPGVENIAWTPADGLSCDDCLTPTAIVSTTTSFTISGEVMGCPTSAGVTVNIKNAPPIQFPADVNLCTGESVILNGASEPGATYTWSSTDPAFNQFNEQQPNVTPSQTTTYTVSATNGCVATGSVTINVTNANLTISNDTSLCRYAPALLTASGTVPGTYLWSNGMTGQAISVTADASQVYNVIYTYGDGCTQTANVNMIVSGESVQLEIPDPTQLCPGQSITLNSAAVPAGGTYVWTASPPDPTLNSNAGNPTVTPGATTTYTVSATLGECTNTRSVTIGVAVATLSLPADVTICADETITLAATDSGGDLLWSTGATTSSISVTPPATTTYSATLVYGNNCILTDEVSVTVNPSFSLAVVAAPNTPSIDLGATLELTASVSPTGQYTYEWLENGVENVGNQQIISIPVSTDEDSVRYILVVTSANGCVKEVSIGYKVNQPVVDIPNAFTPNGDGNNETFKLVVSEGIVFLEKMEIFNRWGQKVFESEDDNAAWNGTVDGKPAPVDVYIYRVSWRKGDGALQEPRVGEITLLR